MRIAGIDLPTGAVADLALLLHRAGENNLAHYIGRAADNNRPDLDLNPWDRRNMLRALRDDPPPSLAELRAGLVRGL